MRLYLTLIGLCITIQMQAQSQFTGHSGVYFLGSANVPISTSGFSNPNINGAVVRFRWNDLEPSPGNFNWTFIDGEIAKAITYNKKISLQPLGIPNWLGSIGAQQYYTIQDNPSSPNFGQITTGVIPWDSVYVSRFRIFLQNLANQYANNPVVSYVNVIGVNFSRNLPDSILTDTVSITKQAFWTAHNYNADSLGALMNEMTDYYMGLFPSTPLWCSVDYVTFQPNASGQARNYLASIYCNYGVTNYPDRFGLFREDVSGCNPNLSNIATTSHWYLMQQNPCRTGAQMLWSVQDGPSRMNQCGILPNTEAMVLDSAVNKGLALGMRYLEIYGSDITDASLNSTIQEANNDLIAEGLSCQSNTGLNGCTNNQACNFNPLATQDDGTCTFPSSSYLNCSGICNNDSNGNGICDEIESNNTSTNTVPASISYQAVARNAQGQPLSDAAVQVKFTLFTDSLTGAAEYSESHSLTTNTLGLFTTAFGAGTPVSGTFTGINWAAGSKYLKVELDAGNGFVDMGTQQLLSVPYSMRSNTSAKAGTIENSGLPVYADNAAALAGGLVAGQMYRTATGDLKIVY